MSDLSNGTPTLIERRDARRIREIARDLVVSTTTLPVGDGRTLTVAPVAFLLQLRDAFGDEGMADCWAVVDGPQLRALKHPAGIRTLNDELQAMRAIVDQRESPAVPAPEPVCRASPETAMHPWRTEPMVQTRVVRSPSSATTPEPIADLIPGSAPMTAEEIRSAKHTLGLSCRAFAAALGVSESTVTWWLSGRFRPTPPHVAAIRALVANAPAPGPLPVAPRPRRPSLPCEEREAATAEVRALMRDAGLDPRALAAALGVSEAATESWRLGRYVPKADNLVALRRLVNEQKGGGG